MPEGRRPFTELVLLLCLFGLIAQGLYIARLRAQQVNLHGFVDGAQQGAIVHRTVAKHAAPTTRPTLDHDNSPFHDDESGETASAGARSQILTSVELTGGNAAAELDEQGAPKKNSGSSAKVLTGSKHSAGKHASKKQRLRGKFDGASELRIVFLHVRKTGGSTAWALLRKLLPAAFRNGCLCGIKSPPMYESSGCAAEARNLSSTRALTTQGNTHYSLNSAAASFVEDSDLDRSGGLEEALLGAGYKKDWIRTLPQHIKSVMRKNMVATSQAFRALEARCPIVELHHWDISMAAIFKAHGYKVITFVRDPLARLESSYNYEFITAEKNGDRLAKLKDDPNLLDVEKGRFRSWLLRQHSPQETLRMVSGCFVNVVDSFQVQEWKAAQSKQSDALSRWLLPVEQKKQKQKKKKLSIIPSEAATFSSRDDAGAGAGAGADDDDGDGGDGATATADTNLPAELWASTVAHRVAVARRDPHLCLLNPTFDASDQSSFKADAVDLVVQRGNAVLFGGGIIDFVGVQEQWETSLALLAKMFSIPPHLLDAAKKVNARKHLLSISEVLSPTEQEQVLQQLAPDMTFYGALLRRFKQDVDTYLL